MTFLTASIHLRTDYAPEVTYFAARADGTTADHPAFADIRFTDGHSNIGVFVKSLAQADMVITAAVEARRLLIDGQPCAQCGATGSGVVSLPSPGGTIRYCRDAGPCKRRADPQPCGECGEMTGHALTCTLRPADPAYASNGTVTA